MLTEKGSFAYDNEAVIQSSTVQLDIWALVPKHCADISEQVYELLTDEDWRREVTMDVPNPDGEIYHRTMRFTKTFLI